MERHGVRRLPVSLILMAALALLLSLPALSWGHDDSLATHPSHQSFSSATPPSHVWLPAPQSSVPHTQSSVLPTALMFLATLALSRGLWQRRRLTAAGLTCVLGLFSLVVAIHSVHHLSDPERAAACFVFSMSQHVTGAPVDPMDLWVPGLATDEACPGDHKTPLYILVRNVGLQRAPPAFPA